MELAIYVREEMLSPIALLSPVVAALRVVAVTVAMAEHQMLPTGDLHRQLRIPAKAGSVQLSLQVAHRALVARIAVQQTAGQDHLD